MRVVGVIPARYRSTRFEGKALALLGGRPVIQHVYERCAEARLDDLFVATDDRRIADAVLAFGGKALMTSPDHASGTDRVAEAAKNLEAELVVNIQGDEPFISSKSIDQAVEPFFRHPELQMSTLRRVIQEASALEDTNVVKVVTDAQGYALYFSRSLIPYPRSSGPALAYEHIGLYVYRKEFLLKFAALPPGRLEQIECLEQLRALENGYRILAVETAGHIGLSVDTPDDLAKAEEFLARMLRGAAR